MKRPDITARPSTWVLASSLLLPLLALWCCGQLWGSRRVLLGVMLLILTATVVVAGWLMLRILAWCGLQARALYLHTLMLLVRQWLPVRAKVSSATQPDKSRAARRATRDD